MTVNDTEFAGQTSDTVGGFFIQDEGGKLLIKDFMRIAVAKLLLDGTDSSGTNDGVQVATEDGDSLILDGTDVSSSDANSKIFLKMKLEVVTFYLMEQTHRQLMVIT